MTPSFTEMLQAGSARPESPFESVQFATFSSPVQFTYVPGSAPPFAGGQRLVVARAAATVETVDKIAPDGNFHLPRPDLPRACAAPCDV